jgi:hypothetical protein
MHLQDVKTHWPHPTDSEFKCRAKEFVTRLVDSIKGDKFRLAPAR